jgi:hypothetical protein
MTLPLAAVIVSCGCPTSTTSTLGNDHPRDPVRSRGSRWRRVRGCARTRIVSRCPRQVRRSVVGGGHRRPRRDEILVLDAVVRLPGLRNAPGTLKACSELSHVDRRAGPAGGLSKHASNPVAQTVRIPDVSLSRQEARRMRANADRTNTQRSARHSDGRSEAWR